MENQPFWIQSVPSSLSSDNDQNAAGKELIISLERQVTSSVLLHKPVHNVLLYRFLQKNGGGNLTVSRYRTIIRYRRDISRIIADRRTFLICCSESLKEKEG